MKKTKTNPIVNNPILKELFTTFNSKIDTDAINHSRFNLNKEHQVIKIAAPTTIKKLNNLIIDSGYNTGDYLINIYIKENNGSHRPYEGALLSRYGEYAKNNKYSDFCAGVPYHRIHTKTEFTQRLKNNASIIILLQKTENAKSVEQIQSAHRQNFLKDNYSRYTQVKNSYNTYINKETGRKTYIYTNKAIDKSGYLIYRFKEVLNIRLSEYKKETAIKRYEKIKALNHLENTKKALLKLFESKCDDLVYRFKRFLLNPETTFRVYACDISYIQKNIASIDNLSSDKVLKNYIKNIIRDIKTL